MEVTGTGGNSTIKGLLAMAVLFVVCHSPDGILCVGSLTAAPTCAQRQLHGYVR